MQQKQLRFSTNEETNKNHRTENSRLYRRGNHDIINSASLLFCSQCNVIVLDVPSNLKLPFENTCVPSASHISFMLLDLSQLAYRL